MFYVTQSAVKNKSSEVQLLVQLMNDTPLLRSVKFFKFKIKLKIEFFFRFLM